MATNYAAVSPPSRSIPDIIEVLGLGRAQMKALVCGGGVWLADGAELLLIGTVTRAVADTWSLEPWTRGLVVSVVFVGIFFGNMLSGIAGDMYGRRFPIQASYLLVFVFSLLSAVAPNVWFLMFIRLLVGFAFGFGQPAWTALCTEITPSDSRILMNALGQSLFSVGEIFSACLILSQDPYMVQLNWRKLLALGAVPSFFLFLISFRLQESPSYLALHDKYDDARSNLKQMALDNGLVPRDDDFHFQPPTVVTEKDSMVKMWKTFGILAGERMLFSTFVMVYSCLVMNVLFYGCLYAFPQIVTDVDMAQSPAMSLVIGSLWGIPGYLMAYLCSEFFERKPCIMIFFILMIIALSSFNIGGHMSQGTLDYLPSFLTNFGFMGIKLFTPIGFVCIYQYVSEIYPTSARATGTALCLAGGRMGGMLAPLLFEETQRMSGDWSLFFQLIVVLVVIDFFLVALLPYRCVKKLEDHDPGDALYTGPSLLPSVDM